MCECQGNPRARVTLALGLPYLLVNRALVMCLALTVCRSPKESNYLQTMYINKERYSEIAYNGIL